MGQGSVAADRCVDLRRWRTLRKRANLVRFFAGGPTSYSAIAESRGSTYFSLNNWSAVERDIGTDNMWAINRAFLEQQVDKGKSFFFTVDPRSLAPATYTAREFQYLTTRGYRLVPEAGGFRAVK